MQYARRAARNGGMHLLARLRQARSRFGRGFTLIELLIVVVIISVIAAVAVPAMLSRLARTQDELADVPDEPIRQAPPSAVAGERPGGGLGVPPVIESSTIELDLRASHVLDGFRVFTRYDADYRGTFVVRNADPVVDTITLSFPFPPDINEARGVSLQFLDSQGNLDDPQRVAYGLEGIEWTGWVEPGATVTAVVTYTAQGRDAFVYDVVGRGRSGTVQVVLQLNDAPRAVVPPGALQPSERAGSRLSWRFDALITNKSIVVELPAGASPLGRVILVLQLAGLAVLMFGGGFWYLSEGQAPGRLDDFRWGHFLLLALNYSMFFGIFAVLGYQGSPTVALTIAAVVSLPLLTFHGVRISDALFTVTRILHPNRPDPFGVLHRVCRVEARERVPRGPARWQSHAARRNHGVGGMQRGLRIRAGVGVVCPDLGSQRVLPVDGLVVSRGHHGPVVLESRDGPHHGRNVAQLSDG